MVASPEHPELMLEKKKSLKRCGLIPQTFVFSELTIRDNPTYTHLALFVRRMTSLNSMGKYYHLGN